MILSVTSTPSVIDIRKNRLRGDILGELFRSKSTSINKLARQFHSSIPSATAIVNELIKDGWIIENGIGPARAGRPPVLYGLNPNHAFTLVVDITYHDLHLAIFDLGNNRVASKIIERPLLDNSLYLDGLMTQMNDFMAINNMPKEKLWGIGVDMPGLINDVEGINYTFPNLAPGGALENRIQEEFNVPVSLLNDTRAGVIGEHRFGLAKNNAHVLTINIDWGVGLGILINGEVFNGTNGFAGELGHIQVRPDGELCHCGKVGCLDTICSATALERQARLGVSSGKATLLPQLVDNDLSKLETAHIIEAVHAGDEFSIDLLSVLGTELGKGLATAVHLFNPEIIIVTGIMALAGPYITNPIEQAINRYCLADFKRSLKLSISELGSSARTLGTQAHLFEFLCGREFPSAIRGS